TPKLESTVTIELVQSAPVTSREMKREDIELVRLARDAVALCAATDAKLKPTLGEDARGSFGYLPFLGRYLRDKGAVFTRISKRELKDGKWFNRMRGCQCIGLFEPWGNVADMTVKSALRTATRSRKVQPGPAVFHKPVWPSELGDLSLFLYVVEEVI